MLTTQAAVTAAAVPFEGVDPDEVMKKLYDLRDSYAKINGKQFWASYVNKSEVQNSYFLAGQYL
jgi:hypothetical protein